MRAMPKYNRLGTVPVEDVLPLILQHMTPGNNKKEIIRVPLLGTQVNVCSLRLKTFAVKGVKCAHPGCNIVGQFFAVEKDLKAKEDALYHINLWGYDSDGNEVLMTHDHKLARGLGGKDVLSNAQTMCGPHNWTKGDQEGKEAQRRKQAKKLTGKSNEPKPKPVAKPKETGSSNIPVSL